MELILIRHFQTPGNLQNRYIGRIDEGLVGKYELTKQIEKTKKFCKGVDKVAASPMRRCMETAALLFPEKEPLLLEKLRECDFGIFEGKTYAELKHLPVYTQWLQSQGTLPIPGGENSESFRARCLEGFRECVLDYQGEGIKKAAMIVHGGSIMAVLEGTDSQERGFYNWQVKNGRGYRVFLNEEDWSQGTYVAREIEKL